MHVERLEARLLCSIFRVGPTEPYHAIHDVPLASLQPGDDVKVDWQTGLYHDKLDICAGGCPGNPVTIEGLPGPEGELPILEANGAIENLDASYPHADVFGAAGLITVMPDATAEHISDVVIKGFEIRHATRNALFTDFTGTVRPYSYSSAGVAIYSADRVTVTGCLIHGNEIGIFAKSQGWTYGDCHYLTVSHDRIHSNGLAGSDRCHNTYIEGAYTLYEFDDYGALLTGAEASTNLADRGVGTIVRYCHLSGGSNVLNLIEPDDGAPSLDALPGFGTEWVYGCIVVNPNGSNCSVIIHFGTDYDGPVSQTDLWFYDNTVVSYNDYTQGGRYYTYVFSGWSDITIHAMNNIFDSVCLTPGDWSGEWALATGGSYGSTVTVSLGAVRVRAIQTGRLCDSDRMGEHADEHGRSLCECDVPRLPAALYLDLCCGGWLSARPVCSAISVGPVDEQLDCAPQ